MDSMAAELDMDTVAVTAMVVGVTHTDAADTAMQAEVAMPVVLADTLAVVNAAGTAVATRLSAEDSVAVVVVEDSTAAVVVVPTAAVADTGKA